MAIIFLVLYKDNEGCLNNCFQNICVVFCLIFVTIRNISRAIFLKKFFADTQISCKSVSPKLNMEKLGVRFTNKMF